MKNTMTERRRKAAPTSAVVTSAARAALLDRLADLELQHRCHAAAERLAWRAAAPRETGR